MILGIPTLVCYDRLTALIESAERGSVRPEKYVIVDNGRGLQSYWTYERPRKGPPVVNMEIAVPAENLGVARSWNWLLRHAGNDSIVISNDDILLGEHTLRDFERTLPEHAFVASEGFSLFGMTPACREKVGWFDENFYPAYFEDCDYHYRMHLAGLPGFGIDRPASHARSSTLATAPPLERQKIDHGFMKNREYYRQKWGGFQGEEKFTVPFDGKPPKGWKERG